MKTPAIQTAKLVKLITEGCSIRDACNICGINHQTYYNWLEKGKNGDKRYVDLVDALKTAESAFKKHHLGNICKAANEGTWQAAAWLLERKYPEEYGRREKIEMNMKLDELVKVLGHVEANEETETDS